jgi:transposase-like protein
MSRSEQRRFSDEQEREIIALYQRSNAPVTEVLNAYGLQTSRLYAILNRHGITRRTKQQRSTAPLTDERKDTLTESLGKLPSDLTVTTDANGFVQTVERTPASRKVYQWEVRFESAIRIEAASITEAISEVQKMPMCRRVFNVALKTAP